MVFCQFPAIPAFNTKHTGFETLNSENLKYLVLGYYMPHVIALVKTRSRVLVVHIYLPVTGQRHTLTVGRSAHYSLH